MCVCMYIYTIHTYIACCVVFSVCSCVLVVVIPLLLLRRTNTPVPLNEKKGRFMGKVSDSGSLGDVEPQRPTGLTVHHRSDAFRAVPPRKLRLNGGEDIGHGGRDEGGPGEVHFTQRGQHLWRGQLAPFSRSRVAPEGPVEGQCLPKDAKMETETLRQCALKVAISPILSILFRAGYLSSSSIVSSPTQLMLLITDRSPSQTLSSDLETTNISHLPKMICFFQENTWPPCYAANHWDQAKPLACADLPGSRESFGRVTAAHQVYKV